MKSKKGETSNSIIIQIVLIALIMAMFLFANASKINARGFKQDLIESEIAMLIESAVPGMNFTLEKVNPDGIINEIKVENSKVYVTVDSLKSSKGKYFFSLGKVRVEDLGDKYRVSVYED